MHIYTYMHLYTHMYMYTHVYIYIHIKIYLHVYMYTLPIKSIWSASKCFISHPKGVI